MKKSWFVALVLCLAHNVACVAPVQFARQRLGTAGNEARVLIIKGTDNPLIERVITAFEEQVPYEIREFSITGTLPAEQLQRLLDSEKPQLVFLLGIRAASLAKHIDSLPTLFAMVPNYQKWGLAPRSNLMGIALEAPPASDFMQFKILAPDLKNVLVIYQEEESGEAVRAAERELLPWDVHLVLANLEEWGSVEEAYETLHTQVDAIWMHNDSGIMNSEAFRFLRDSALEDRLMLLASLSGQLAHEGAFAAVSLDFGAIGSQAATMTNLVLTQQRTANELGIQLPVGGLASINMDTARALGRSIPEQALNFVHEVIAASQSAVEEVAE